VVKRGGDFGVEVYFALVDCCDEGHGFDKGGAEAAFYAEGWGEGGLGILVGECDEDFGCCSGDDLGGGEGGDFVAEDVGQPGLGDFFGGGGEGGHCC